jgi:hypothetical protein
MRADATVPTRELLLQAAEVRSTPQVQRPAWFELGFWMELGSDSFATIPAEPAQTQLLALSVKFNTYYIFTV